MRERYGAGLPGFEPPPPAPECNLAKVDAVSGCEPACAPVMEELPPELGPPAEVIGWESVRRLSDMLCRHCFAQRYEVLQAVDERGRLWVPERCGCRY